MKLLWGPTLKMADWRGRATGAFQWLSGAAGGKSYPAICGLNFSDAAIWDKVKLCSLLSHSLEKSIYRLSLHRCDKQTSALRYFFSCSAHLIHCYHINSENGERLRSWYAIPARMRRCRTNTDCRILAIVQPLSTELPLRTQPDDSTFE